VVLHRARVLVVGRRPGHHVLVLVSRRDSVQDQHRRVLVADYRQRQDQPGNH
jgi:hypothetical protein